MNRAADREKRVAAIYGDGFTSLVWEAGQPRLAGGGDALLGKSRGSRRLVGGGLRLRRGRAIIFCMTLLITAFVTGGTASAAGTLENIIETLFGESTQTVDIVIMLTLMTLLPSILMMLTSFTRIIIVFSFVRNALGMQQSPPSQVLIGLALFLTLFVMGPVITTAYEDAYVPYTNGEITQSEMIDRAMVPTRSFMARQMYTADLEFFMGLSREEIPEVTDTEDVDEVLRAIPNKVLIPAFLTSEIKTAFKIGFFVYIPFIVIDMVVASTLMAMGMMMLPPAMISLPFKVLLFVMIDGWQLIIGAVIQSFK